MAPLFASSSHASLLPLLSPSPAAPARLHYTLRSRLPVRVASGRRLEGGIPDEWGERSQPVPEPPSQPDPPIDDDEWGRASASGSASWNSRRPVVADEWGEPGEPEAEAPSPADPPINDDEWGRASASASGNSRPVVADEWGELGKPEAEAPSPADPPINDDEWGGDPTPPVGEGAPEDDKEERREELKRCLVDTVYGSDLGLRASAEVRGEVVELVAQLEAANPTPAPVQAPELLDGNWILIYTAYSELLPILLAGATPFSKVQKISQEIDTKSMTIVNASTISTPFASFSFSATAAFDVQSPSRIEVQFKEGSFQPPEISSSVDLPAQIDIFGQKISLGPVQQALNPLQQAFSSIAGSISGQPPLKVPIPGNNRARSWLLTTYLDKDFRISRGDGGLFILAKQGSPLLDQL